MQVLWSRVAQTRSSCRCVSCLHAATAVTRQTTTAASKRQLKISDVLTACYSTILATAAFADAKVKEDRRKEWDRVISEAKAGVSFNKSGAPQRLGSNSLQRESIPGSSYKSNGTWDALPEVLEDGTNMPFSLLQDSRRGAGCLGTCVPNTIGQHQLVKLDNLEDDHTCRKFLPAREPVTDLHLFMKQRHTGKLIYQMLVASGIELAPWRRFGFFSDLQKTEQRTLHKLGYTTNLPAYSWPSDCSVAEERIELHKSIIILRREALKDFNADLFVTKVCYNLLVTTSPPSIDTYNLLIDSFTQLGRHDLAKVVIKGFFQYSRFRPNTATIRLILNHYWVMGDPNGFRMVVKRMRAVDGDMRIKRRELSDLYHPITQKWALTRDVIKRGEFLTQKVLRTRRIFETLVRGSLDLTSLTAAVHYVRAALREGWQIEGALMLDLIKACVDRVDYAAAKSLMKIILLQWHSGKIFPAIAFSADVRYTLYRLLQFCGIDPLFRGHHISMPVQALLSHMRLESVAEAIERLSGTIDAVKKALGISHFDSPTAFPSFVNGDLVFGFPELSWPEGPKPDLEGITEAFVILRNASKAERRRPAKQRQSIRTAWLLNLQMATSRLAVISQQIEGCQKELLSILGCRLSAKGRALYSYSLQKQGHNTLTSRLNLMPIILQDEMNVLETPRHIFARQPGIDKVILTTRKVPHQRPSLTLNGRVVFMRMSPREENLDQLSRSQQVDNLVKVVNSAEAATVVRDSRGSGNVVHYYYPDEPVTVEPKVELQVEPTVALGGDTSISTCAIEMPPNENLILSLGESITPTRRRDHKPLPYLDGYFTHSGAQSRLCIPPVLLTPLAKQAAYL